MARHDTGAHDASTETTRSQAQAPRTERAVRDDSEAREKFGGINWGAGFFGWLVAVGITILLTGIIGAVLARVGSTMSITQSEARAQSSTIGITAAVIVLAILALAYYTGGYVAGRMSRFDGAKQGLAVWLIGLLVTLLAGALGLVAGDAYNVLERVNLPSIPLSTQDLSAGGAITVLAILILTALAAMLGGKVGHRYHDKVDRAAGF